MQKIENTIAALGTESFASALLETLNDLSRVDHYAVIRFDGGDTARLVLSASRPGLRIDRAVQDEYIGHFHRLDPNRMLFDGPIDSSPQVGRMQRNRVPDSGYRWQCYDRPGLVDRLSVIAPGEGGWYCLNMFRTRDSKLFSAGEEESIQGAAALLAALTIKHDGIFAPSSNPGAERHQRMSRAATRLQALKPRLSPREIDVALRIVAGVSSEGIALDLGIGINSVLTYRKRLYVKLRISSQNELFSLCLLDAPACHTLM